MAKQDRGTKREDPETGRKFYDLNRDPIISPYTGKSYPRSYFEQNVARRAGSDRAKARQAQLRSAGRCPPRRAPAAPPRPVGVGRAVKRRAENL